MSDVTIFLWWLLPILAVAVVIAVLAWWRRKKRLLEVFRTLVEKSHHPLLIYDDRGRLIYKSTGLVVFDPNCVAKLKNRKELPARGQELMGELEIDGNRYRYRGNLVEYSPGGTVTVLYLEYQGGQSGSK
jgi:hypothetical protein